MCRQILAKAPVGQPTIIHIHCHIHSSHLPLYFVSFKMSEIKTTVDYKSLVCELCRQFFQAGWVTGTGGSISIRDGDKIYMTPSGVQKERIQPDEIFTVDLNGKVTDFPDQKSGCGAPKLSDCAPLFLHAYQQRNAGAVLHSHSISTNLVTTILEGVSEFTISHQEMIKGIDGHGFFDTLTIPIIENTAWEHELADSLGEAIAKYPKACAVLVRRHGMYVWGKTWEQAKRHGECLHYLLDIALSMHKLGLDFNSPVLPVGSKRKFPSIGQHRPVALSFKHLLLDIEGTTTPITFVKDTLFPYALAHAKTFLDAHWEETVIRSIVSDLIAQALTDGLSIAQFAADTKEQSLESISSFVADCIRNDRKISPLKKLQGLIWEAGYAGGELKGALFEDVAESVERVVQAGANVSIYSSGSKHAQQLLFGHSSQGDLRPKLTCYFDTKVGQKSEEDSYREILLTLGALPTDVLFVTDILSEAKAARAAGLQVLLSVRPGNAEIREQHEFRTICSFSEII